MLRSPRGLSGVVFTPCTPNSSPWTYASGADCRRGLIQHGPVQLEHLHLDAARERAVVSSAWVRSTETCRSSRRARCASTRRAAGNSRTCRSVRITPVGLPEQTSIPSSTRPGGLVGIDVHPAGEVLAVEQVAPLRRRIGGDGQRDRQKEYGRETSHVPDSTPMYHSVSCVPTVPSPRSSPACSA